MCGIVGLYLKNPDLEPRLGRMLSAMLIQMTDRGPDSAGIAVVRDGEISVRKRRGRLANLEEAITDGSLDGALAGIGHTRWASPGEPSGGRHTARLCRQEKDRGRPLRGRREQIRRSLLAGPRQDRSKRVPPHGERRKRGRSHLPRKTSRTYAMMEPSCMMVLHVHFHQLQKEQSVPLEMHTSLKQMVGTTGVSTVHL